MKLFLGICLFGWIVATAFLIAAVVTSAPATAKLCVAGAGVVLVIELVYHRITPH